MRWRRSRSRGLERGVTLPLGEWEPEGWHGNRGDYLVGFPQGGAMFVETKRPSWRSEVAKSEGQDSPRLGLPKYINGEARSTEPWQGVRNAIDRAIQQCPDSVPTLYVIDGQFKIWRGDEVLDVGRGGIAFLPRGVPHTYQNIGASPGRLLTVITPGGFEGFFRDVSTRRLSVPEHLKEITETAEKYGLAIVGPPPGAR